MKIRKYLLLAAALFLISFQQILAQQSLPLDLALQHLEVERENLKLTAEDITNFRISDQYPTKHNRVTHIFLNQQHEKIDVQNALININVLPNGAILNMGNRFVSDLANKVNTTTPTITPEFAIQQVIDYFEIENSLPIRLVEEKENNTYLFNHEDIALEPIRVKLVLEKMSNQDVRLAWRVEFYELNGQNSWNARMDATNGEMLSYNNEVIHCNFSIHEECTDPTHTHSHTHAPHVKKKNVESEAPAIAANGYNVFALPIESPNHGDRSIVTDPADLSVSPLGWHDDNSNQYTITRGNNVHAYHDIFDMNESAGDEPDGTASLDFDYPLDLAAGLPYQNSDAAITNLFYWNNIVHDVWYHYGFDEAAGNFQEFNFGNGGQGGDHIHAQAMDGSGTNNANFRSGQDGDNGRMQMYVWGNGINLPDPSGSPLDITAPAAAVGQYEMIPALFGAPLPTTGIVGEFIFVDDGVDVTTNGCETLVNAADIAGKIAMIDRGGCQYGTKVLAAENAGAIAVVVCNSNGGPPPAMSPGDEGDLVTITAVMISEASCLTIRSALPGVIGELKQQPPSIPLPGPQGFDSDFDNGVIVHEYGHGISIRSTGGPSNSSCLQNFEQAGEGWSDWFGLAMLSDTASYASQKRGIGTYVTGEAIDGDGIRPYPYSRSMGINPHTYKNINGVSVPHGVGSVWAVMIWDLYWNLVDQYGFDTDIYNGTSGNNMAMQLVYDGIKLQACSPTFIDSRDAILAADLANYNGENECLIWKTFARRGLGVEATPGGNEDFSIPDRCDFSLKINKTASAGEIRGGQNITYTIEAKNDTGAPLTNVTISDVIPEGTSYVVASTTCPNTSVVDDLITIDVGTMSTTDVVNCSYELRVDDDPTSILIMQDGVEENNVLWDQIADIGNTTWQTSVDAFEGDRAWFANNTGFRTDQYLESKFEYAINSPNARMSFWHKYDTQTGSDGGVLEITTNGGNNWFDVNNFILENGYIGPLQEDETSELSERPAFHGKSNGYIRTVVNLSAYVNKDIKFRFRFASNESGGGDGWYIDNIRLYEEFYAITNEACVSSDLNENKCSDVTTIVLGENFVDTEEIENELKVSIAPNPTKGIVYLTIHNNENTKSNIRIASVDGKLLRNEVLSNANGTFPIDMSNYPSGMYFLQIQSGDHIAVEKVVLNK